MGIRLVDIDRVDHDGQSWPGPCPRQDDWYIAIGIMQLHKESSKMKRIASVVILLLATVSMGAERVVLFGEFTSTG